MKDAEELVESIRKWESEKRIEYFRFESQREKGLSDLFFTIQGSKELSERCGDDVCVIDSTLHVPKYSYKLVSMQYMDSELVSRPFAFAIMLDESPKDYMAFCKDVCYGTKQKLARVVFSDEDSSVISALTLVPSRYTRNGIPPARLTCIWHLLDLKMRKAVGSSIEGGAVNWKCFRTDFIAVRSSTSEEELSLRFCKLLQMWFCQTEDCDDGPACNLHGMCMKDFQKMEFKNTRSGRALRYMLNHVWPIGENWAFCFFHITEIWACSHRKGQKVCIQL